MGAQREVLTVANILKKVATGDERELMAVAESKLCEAGHRTLWWSTPPPPRFWMLIRIQNCHTFKMYSL